VTGGHLCREQNKGSMEKILLTLFFGNIAGREHRGIPA
jgi:hypothetical protein